MEKVKDWIHDHFLSIPDWVRGKMPGWIFLGLTIRLVLIPFFVQIDFGFTGDIVAFNQVAHLLVFNPDSPLRILTLYPPLAYYTMAFFQVSFYHLAPAVPLDIYGFQATMNWLTGGDVFRQLFFFKIWYLIFDLGAAYLIWRIFKDDQHKSYLVLAFWMLNPIIIYTTYFHGQFDVVPVFFTILALFCVQKGHSYWAVFFIGIAACYKNYAFFFLPPAVLILTELWGERVKLFLLGTVPYVLLILPRLGEYTHSVSNYGDLFFKVGYDLGAGAQVFVFFGIYAVLLWYLYQRRANTFEDLWRACFVILLIYFQFSYSELHYWIWLIPFAAIFLAERPTEVIPLYLVIGLGLLVLQLSILPARFLAPISPSFFLRLPGLTEALNPYLPMLLITNVVRSLLVGTCFYLAWRLVRDMPASRPEAALPPASPQITA